MTAEINFSVGDRVIHTEGRNMVTVIGTITAISPIALTIETEFCSNAHGIRIPGSEHVERLAFRIPFGTNQTKTVRLDGIVSSVDGKGYLSDR